jgi:tetratricopeptide (TPR) repeat protein
MKKAFLAAAVIIVGLAIWYQFRQPAPSSEPPQTSKAAVSMKTLKSSPIPRAELETAKIAGERAQTPEACSAQWERTATLSLEQLQEDLKRGVLRFDPQCADFELQNDLVKQAYAACAFDATSGKLADETECLNKFPLYRTLCIDRLTPDQKDYRSMSMALLVNKFIGRFMQNNQTAENREELRSMVNAMIEREPGLPDARKALVAVEFGGLFTPEHSSDGMRAAVDAAMRLSPNDPQLTEAYLFTEQMAGNLAAANEFVEHNPDSGLGYYYRAWSEWQSGDRENALADLQQSARLLPGDARVAKTLTDVEAGKKDSVFNIMISFNFGEI